MTVLAYGFPLDSNFGGPSVAHGLFAALRQLNSNADLVVYQQRPIDPVSVSDMKFAVRFFPYRNQVKRLMYDWMRVYVLRRQVRDPERAQFWSDFRKADVIANIYAICFCERLAGRGACRTFKQSLKKLFWDFTPSLLARLSGKVSVKTTSSYGPIVSRGEKFAAWLACNFFFKRIFAREEEGRAVLKGVHVLRGIHVVPDLANCMPFARPGIVGKRPLGVSVSFMSERQWVKESESYVNCMRGLLEHMRAVTGRPLVVFPNQVNVPGGRDDIVIAEEIVRGLESGPSVEIFDVRNNGSLALKQRLAGCEMLVSCRYHSCVAALSAGVPVLVLGWHDKYVSLMSIYGQRHWMVSAEESSLQVLRTRFDDLWGRRDLVRREILEHMPIVTRRVRESVRYMLSGAVQEP